MIRLPLCFDLHSAANDRLNMLPTEGGEEETVPVDIKSRIAAFSQGAAPVVVSRENGPAPPVPRLAKPTLRKTPSTSQLLPAWQQQQRQKENDSNALLKPEHAAASSRPRAYTGEASNGNSPKLGVKGIIALYGQQAQTGADSPASEVQSRSREGSYDAGGGGGLSPNQFSSRPSSMDTLRRAVPPPTLPPRPKNSNALLSQTNTGSSSHSSSSTGLSSSAAMASPPPSSYAPYLRKGQFAAGTGSSSGTESTVPSLPRRQVGAAQSLEDLSLDPPRSTNLSSAMGRKLGSGPKWASSSSGNLTMQGENSSSNGSPTIAPAVPPRASVSVTNSPSSSYVPPPPKRTVPMQSPSTARRSTTVSVYGTPIPSPSPATASPSSTTEFATRSAKSSLTTQAWSNNSPTIAPPPRHVDIRRMGPLQTHVSSSSTSSLRSAKKQQRKRFKTLQAGAVYTREPGEAEQRYSLLFDRLIREQRAKGIEVRDGSLLNKRTVVRIWKQSQLENWFLACVWDAATSTEDAGLAKAPFTRAMSAIDYELSRRQAERQGRTVF